MSKRNNTELFTDMLESIEKVFRYTEGMSFQDFLGDDRTVDAVVRNFEIIGEAANRIDEATVERFPEVNWRRIIALRHRIAHDYFGINYTVLWEIREKNLRDLQRQIESIINQLS